MAADDTPRARAPRREPKKDWVAFPLRVPRAVDVAVRELADADVLAPSLNTVYVALIREALAARRGKPSK